MAPPHRATQTLLTPRRHHTAPHAPRQHTLRSQNLHPTGNLTHIPARQLPQPRPRVHSMGIHQRPQTINPNTHTHNGHTTNPTATVPTMPTPRTMPIPHPRPTVPTPRRHTDRHRPRTTTHQHNNKRNPQKNDTTTIPTSIRVRPTTRHIRLHLDSISQIPKPRTHNTNRSRENHATLLNARYTTQFHHTDTKTNTAGNTTTMNPIHTPSSPVPSTPIDDTGPFSFPQNTTTPPKKAPRQPSRPAEGHHPKNKQYRRVKV